MFRRSTITITALATALAIVACESEVTGPGSGEAVRSVGILEYRGDLDLPEGIEDDIPDVSEPGVVKPARPLEAPDVVESGVPFIVRATTVGDGCTEADGVEVEKAGLTAEITAYDVREGEVCITIARFLTREVALQFDTPGEATIRLIGRRVDNGQDVPGDVIVEKQVLVQ